MLNVCKRICLLLALVLPLAGCDQFIYRADAIEGWVVDAGTGQPLDGVIVVAHWELEGGFEGGVPINELQIYEAVTDERGRYYFPKWGPKLAIFGNLKSRSPRILLFKRGYRYLGLDNDWYIGRDTTKSDWNGKTVKLERFERSLKEYAEHLWSLNDTLWRVGHEWGDPCDWESFPKMLQAMDRLDRDYVEASVVRGTVVSDLRASKANLEAAGCAPLDRILAP